MMPSWAVDIVLLRNALINLDPYTNSHFEKWAELTAALSVSDRERMKQQDVAFRKMALSVRSKHHFRVLRYFVPCCLLHDAEELRAPLGRLLLSILDGTAAPAVSPETVVIRGEAYLLKPLLSELTQMVTQENITTMAVFQETELLGPGLKFLRIWIGANCDFEATGGCPQILELPSKASYTLGLRTSRHASAASILRT